MRKKLMYFSLICFMSSWAWADADPTIVHDNYVTLKERIVDGKFTYFHVTNALKAVLSQVMEKKAKDDDEAAKFRRINALLATTDRFLKQPSLFSENSDVAKNLRSRFFLQVQLAVQLSDDLNDTKLLVWQALMGD